MWWLIPVIPALWEAELDHLRSGDRDQSDQQDETKLVSLKNTKISWAWWWVPVIPATREAEAGESLEPVGMEDTVSQDHATALQPG